MLENFICEIDSPLIAMKILIRCIQEQLEEEGFFKPETRKSAEKISALINALKCLTNEMIAIQKRYNNKFQQQMRVK